MCRLLVIFTIFTVAIHVEARPAQAASAPARPAPRLRAQYYVGGGATAFANLWDTELSFPCTFAKAQDGVIRCLPFATLQTSDAPGSQYYLEETCTTPFVYVLLGQSVPKYFMRSFDVTAAPPDSEGIPAYALGDQLDPSRDFFICGSGSERGGTLQDLCSGETCQFYLFSAVKDPSIFVQGSLVTF